jgi:hypothetical protein
MRMSAKLIGFEAILNGARTFCNLACDNCIIGFLARVSLPGKDLVPSPRGRVAADG